MLDYLYLKLLYLYEDRKVFLASEPLWVKFCVWFLHTFFADRMWRDAMLKLDAKHKKEIKDLERRFQMLKEAYLKVTGELAADEVLGKGAESGDMAWLEEDYPRRRRKP